MSPQTPFRFDSSGSHPIAPAGILAGSPNPLAYPANQSTPDAQMGVGAGEKK